MRVSNVMVRATIIAAAALSGGLVPQRAEARSFGAAGGITVPADRTCIETAGSGGGIFNACEHTVSYDIMLPIETEDEKQATITARSDNPAHNIGCRAELTNQELTLFAFSNGGNYTHLPSFGSPQDIVVGIAGHPFIGWQFLVNCQVPTATILYTVNWNS